MTISTIDYYVNHRALAPLIGNKELASVRD